MLTPEILCNNVVLNFSKPQVHHARHDVVSGLPGGHPQQLLHPVLLGPYVLGKKTQR